VKIILSGDDALDLKAAIQKNLMGFGELGRGGKRKKGEQQGEQRSKPTTTHPVSVAGPGSGRRDREAGKEEKPQIL
jgi:hypothetical protein